MVNHDIPRSSARQLFDSVREYLPLVLLFCCTCNLAMAEQTIDYTGFSPPPDEYDWVQLTSGEWLKRALISLFDDDLTFDSDNLGMLQIDREALLGVTGTSRETLFVVAAFIVSIGSIEVPFRPFTPLRFGFSATSTNDNGSAVFYDNLRFAPIPLPAAACGRDGTGAIRLSADNWRRIIFIILIKYLFY